LIARADGTDFKEVTKTGEVEDAKQIGIAAAEEIKPQIGDVLEWIGDQETIPEIGKETVGEADGLGGYK
jgi:hypothetical protein